MSKHLVQINALQATAKAEFNTEDQQALGRYSSFTGFEINSIKISKIFSEFTDNTDHEAFGLPETVGEIDYWPENGRVDVSAFGAVLSEFNYFTVNSANFRNSQWQNLLYTFPPLEKMVQRYVDPDPAQIIFSTATWVESFFLYLFFYLNSIFISE